MLFDVITCNLRHFERQLTTYIHKTFVVIWYEFIIISLLYGLSLSSQYIQWFSERVRVMEVVVFHILLCLYFQQVGGFSPRVRCCKDIIYLSEIIKTDWWRIVRRLNSFFRLSLSHTLAHTHCTTHSFNRIIIIITIIAILFEKLLMAQPHRGLLFNKAFIYIYV